MNERPILFSAPMVRTVLEGRKTQTRRVVKPVRGYEHNNICKPDMAADPCSVWWHRSETDRVGCQQNCPYGVPGDRLWVRETWASPEIDKSIPGRVAYDADGVCGCWIRGGEDRHFVYHGRIIQANGYHECFPEGGATTLGLGKYSDIRSGEYPSYRYGWRPSIHMPRWASRITLEVTDVRVQRIHEISEDDARAEGMESCTPADQFRVLWETISGKRCPWASNPWVWAITFKRMEARP